MKRKHGSGIAHGWLIGQNQIAGYLGVCRNTLRAHVLESPALARAILVERAGKYYRWRARVAALDAYLAGASAPREESMVTLAEVLPPRQ